MRCTALTNEDIVEKIRNGISIADNMRLLYEKNLPIIKAICKRYAYFDSMEDLLQESYFGLSEAVQHYEISENVKFMTYAIYWIRQSVTRYLVKNGTVLRLPMKKVEQIGKYKKLVVNYTVSFGRMPTDKEAAKIIGVTEKVIQEIKLYTKGVSSLDTPLQDGIDDITLGDTVKADFSIEEDVIEDYCNEQLKNELWELVEHYTDSKEYEIIKKFYIDGKTMVQIASEMNITLNDVRRIKSSGMKKLRYGKAEKEMILQYELIDSCFFRTGLKSYKEHDFTSIVERIAVGKLSDSIYA